MSHQPRPAAWLKGPSISSVARKPESLQTLVTALGPHCVAVGSPDPARIARLDWNLALSLTMRPLPKYLRALYASFFPHIRSWPDSYYYTTVVVKTK